MPGLEVPAGVVLFWLAVRGSAVLGQTTLRVFGRLTSLLRAAIAVHLVIDGVGDALTRQPPPPHPPPAGPGAGR